MEAYSEFASVYDMFMDNIPYEDWAEYVKSLLADFGIMDGLVVDLGCGTGTLTEILAQSGYDMIGIDYSEDMLNVAIEKRQQSGLDILYLNQDMREFELYGTVRGIISICDSMNYLLEEEELSSVFRLVENYLDTGGVFIFDMNTISKYEQIGDSVIAETREEGSFIWQNYYEEDTHMNEYDLTLFIPGADGRYDKYEENHVQRGYEIDIVRKRMEEAGLEVVAVYDAFTRELPTEDSERIYFIGRKNRENRSE